MAIELKSAKSAGKGATLLDRGPLTVLPKGGITPRDRMFFTERLALLLETGGALQPSLLILKQQAAHPQMARVIGGLADEVLGGRSFAQALARYPEMFSSTYVNLVDAGEQGGFLPRVLSQLIAMEEKREKLRSTLVAAFSYPAFLILFSSGVIIFILAVVFPKFGTLFQSIHDQLPITTRLLMAMSDLLRHHWMVIGGGLGALLYGSVIWLKSTTGHELMSGLKLRLPWLKEIFVQIYLVQVLRVLSLSLASGVGILDALKSSREVIDNLIFQRFMDGVESQVKEGRGLAAGFDSGPFIPVLVRQMIRTGEESGNLDVVMDRVAQFYERELEKNVTMLSKIIEPLMLLIMGVVVGLIVASLILPIFKLSRAVH